MRTSIRPSVSEVFRFAAGQVPKLSNKIARSTLRMPTGV